MLVTQAFDVLASTVAKGVGFDTLHKLVFPHPLNPLSEEKVKAIARDHLEAVVDKLRQAPGGAS